jgi:hypothetical protein
MADFTSPQQLSRQVNHKRKRKSSQTVLQVPTDKVARLESPIYRYEQTTKSHFTLLHFTSLQLTSLHLTSLHLTSLHLTSPHFTSPHFTSNQIKQE